MNHSNTIDPSIRTQTYKQPQLNQSTSHQQDRNQQTIDGRQSMIQSQSYMTPYQQTQPSYQSFQQSSQRVNQNTQILNQNDHQQIIQIMEQQMDIKVNQIVEQKLINIRKEVQNDVNHFKSDIIKMINESNESIHKTNNSQKEQINSIDKNYRDFVQRLSNQHQLLMQEFENSKLLNKQSTVNIETKITEFENFIRLQGSQSNFSIQRRKSMNTKIQIDEVNPNLNPDEKVVHLQSELDNQKAIIQEMQKNMKSVIKHSQSLNLTKKISNGNQQNCEYKLDQNNFLIDNDGKFILNENGKVVQLNNEQVKLLKQNSILK